MGLRVVGRSAVACLRARLLSSQRVRLPPLIAASAITLIAIGAPLTAWAHVKWFAPYDVPAQPRPLEAMLSPAFWLFTLLALVIMVGLEYVGRTPAGPALLRPLDWLGRLCEGRTDSFLRAGVGAFFVAIWALGGFIITPELKSASPLVPWVQVMIAVSMVWDATLIVGAAGIVVLYGIATVEYGVFHLLDYPIFLGVALFLALKGLKLESVLGKRPIDYLRYATSITLMWASIEKWAFPDWTFPLLRAHSDLTLGMDALTYMTAAGVIEFGLGFGLLCGPLVRRSAAFVLGVMFLSAIAEFGQVDAVGHLVIIVVLILLIGERKPGPLPRPLQLVPGYALALTAFLSAYYGLHHFIYHTHVI